ncbi:MAG: transposase [Janthinobacterium lividum]
MSAATAGQRVDAAVPLRNGPNVTIAAALSTQGVEAVTELDGSLNTASFAVYLAQVLGPGLQPGDVVVLDNLPVHKADGLAELVEARGARLLYLPPYSPDFTPIELAFNKLKTHLRTTRRAYPRGTEDRLGCGPSMDNGRRCAKLVWPLWLPCTLTPNML